MTATNDQQRPGLSRRTLLAGAAVGGAGLAASLVEPGVVMAAASTAAGGDPPSRSAAPQAVVVFQFVLEVPGIGTGAFSSFGGLSSETEIIEGKSSDPLITAKRAGKTRYNDVVLSRGMTDVQDFVVWRKMVEDGNVDAARKNCSLVMYDVTGAPVARYHLENAWPAKIAISDLASDAADALMETITIACEHIARVAT